jgi:hypothetical protein
MKRCIGAQGIGHIAAETEHRQCSWPDRRGASGIDQGYGRRLASAQLSRQGHDCCDCVLSLLISMATRSRAKAKPAQHRQVRSAHHRISHRILLGTPCDSR